MMDAKRFYAAIRGSLFGGKLTQGQVDGIGLIVASAQTRGGIDDSRQLAYILATVYHESAKRMQPLRETLGKSDDESIANLDHAFATGRLPQVREPYWRNDAEGKAWFGRGLVQLTHKRNYQLMSVVTGYNLIRNPDLALDAKISCEILVRGMLLGCFSGHKLSDFFKGQRCDWIGARKIVNGNDRASDVAQVAKFFYDALMDSSIEPAAA